MLVRIIVKRAPCVRELLANGAEPEMALPVVPECIMLESNDASNSDLVMVPDSVGGETSEFGVPMPTNLLALDVD